MWKQYNPNPRSERVGDCTIRALAKATGQEWDKVYAQLCLQGYVMADMPSANNVWGAYLKKEGYKRYIVPDESCPECYTVEDFCNDFPEGVYILALSGHVVCVTDGDYYDTWDSGKEIPMYYWKKE